MIRKTVRAALTAALLLGGASIAYAQSAPKMSSAVNKALVEAQTASKKQDFPAAMAAIEKARASSSRTPYDDYMINRYATSLYVQQKDLNGAVAPGEATADTDPSVIPEADKSAVYTTGMQLAAYVKHWDKAAKYAKALLALPTPPDANMQALASQAFYNSGDYAGAQAQARKNIDAAKAAGKLPSRNDYAIIKSAQVQMKDQAAAEQTVEQMVATYNDPKDWVEMLSVSLSTKGMRDIDYVYLGRLMFALNADVPATDMQLVGSNANKQGFYGDAEQAQKKGGPAPDARMATDRKTVPQQITQGAKEGGEYNVKLAQALYGYGMYAEAETAARLAKSKGGTKDSTEADMVIGLSQQAQGKYSEAATTLGGITAPNPAAARVLRLWNIFVKAKAQPATAAAPAQ